MAVLEGATAKDRLKRISSILYAIGCLEPEKTRT